MPVAQIRTRWLLRRLCFTRLILSTLAPTTTDLPLFSGQVLIGAAPLDLVRTARYCHYGLVAALYVLARHSLVSPQGSWESQHYTGLAMRFLGGSGALDFLEDSAWPLSSLVEGLVVPCCPNSFMKALRMPCMCGWP